MGESVRRFVLAEADDFRAYVIWPMSDRPGAEISVAAATATQRMSGAADQALLAVYHAQQAHAWTTNIIDGFEHALASAGVPDRLAPAMCLTYRVTSLSRRGDEAAALTG
jgi:hypothetical protein